MSTGHLLLLSHSNVKAVQRNHPDEFIGALRDIEALTTKTALPFSVDEQRRLAALAVLDSKGLFSESLPTTTSERTVRKRKKEAQPA